MANLLRQYCYVTRCTHSEKVINCEYKVEIEYLRANCMMYLDCPNQDTLMKQKT